MKLWEIEVGSTGRFEESVERFTVMTRTDTHTVIQWPSRNCDSVAHTDTRHVIDVASDHYFRLLAGRVEKATKHSAAFDLFYNGKEPLVLTDQPVAIPTGVITEFSPRLRAQIKEKSGLALEGIELHGGVIDADYRDEWKVIARCPPLLASGAFTESWDWWTFFTFGNTEKMKSRTKAEYYVVQPGQKIAQFVLVELPIVRLEGEGIVVLDAVRTGGLGSTGLKAA